MFLKKVECEGKSGTWYESMDGSIRVRSTQPKLYSIMMEGREITVVLAENEHFLCEKVAEELTKLRTRISEALVERKENGEFGGLSVGDSVFLLSPKRHIFIKAKCADIVMPGEILGRDRAKYYKGLADSEQERLSRSSTPTKRFAFETIEGEYAVLPENQSNRQYLIRGELAK